MKKNAVLLIVLIALAISLGGCGNLEPVTPKEGPEEVLPEAVLSFLQQVTGEPNLQLEYLDSDETGFSLVSFDQNRQFKVNREGNRLLYASFKNLTVPLSRPKLEPEDAWEEGLRYASGFYREINNLVPDKSALNGDKEEFYYFSWQKIEKEVRLPTWISITIDNYQGLITSFELRDFPVTISLETNITKDKADSLAGQEILNPRAQRKVSSMELFTGSFSGKERICWYISQVVTEPRKDGSSLVYIHDVYLDAQSGEILRSQSEKEKLFSPIDVVKGYLEAIKDRDWQGAYYGYLNISQGAYGLKSLQDFIREEERDGWNSMRQDGYKLKEYVLLGEKINNSGLQSEVEVKITVLKNNQEKTLKQKWFLSKVKGEWRLDWLYRD